MRSCASPVASAMMPVASASAGDGQRNAGRAMPRFERLGEALTQRALALHVARRAARVAHGERPVLLQQQDERLLLVGERAHPAADQRCGRGLAGRVLGHAHQLARPPVDALLDQREEDVLLAVEVPVDGALGQARRGGDVLHAGGSVTRARRTPRRRRRAAARAPFRAPRRAGRRSLGADPAPCRENIPV